MPLQRIEEVIARELQQTQLAPGETGSAITSRVLVDEQNQVVARARGGQLVDAETGSVLGKSVKGALPVFTLNMVSGDKDFTTLFSLRESTTDVFWHGTQVMPNLKYVGDTLTLIDPTRSGFMRQYENYYLANGGEVAAAGVNTGTAVFTYTPISGAGEPADSYPAVINVLSADTVLPTTSIGQLVAGTVYWFRDVNTGANTFKLSATQGGAAITVSDAGSGSWVIGHRLVEDNLTVLTPGGQQVRAWNIVVGGSTAYFGSVWGIEIPLRVSPPAASLHTEPTSLTESRKGTTDYTTHVVRGLNTGAGGSSARLIIAACQNNEPTDILSQWSFFTGITTGFSVTGARPLGIRDDVAGAFRIWMDGSGNIGFNAQSFGTSAANVLAIANGTAPSSSPAGMGQMYVESGALKYRGSSGTITTLGNA